ncbi:hypothetical protein [Vreelandella jeotgali]|uniref:hypothetical protein n=1 Tax=Vreelandella jeotgali TaxID=553386 RepID=UPI00037166F5|nr:hypothetical protein [Halomonas jeotgali]
MAFQKTGIGVAIGFLAAFSGGVSTASAAIESGMSHAPLVKKSAARNEDAELRRSIKRMNSMAHRLSRLLRFDIIRLTEMPAGTEPGLDAAQGLEASLRSVEANVRDVLEIVDRPEAEELGLLELRRNLALARSNAVTIRRLAKQKTAAPETHTGQTPGEAFAAIADSMEKNFA